MAPESDPSSDAAGSLPGELRVEVPAAGRFVPVLETAARIYLRSLPAASRHLAPRIEEHLARAAREAVSRRRDTLIVELRYAPPTLLVTVAPAGEDATTVSFEVG